MVSHAPDRLLCLSFVGFSEECYWVLKGSNIGGFSKKLEYIGSWGVM